MLTKEKRTMSNRDLDDVKKSFNGNHRGEDDRRVPFDEEEVNSSDDPEILGIAVPFYILDDRDERKKRNLRCYLSLTKQPTKKGLLKLIDNLSEEYGYKFAWYYDKADGGKFQ